MTAASGLAAARPVDDDVSQHVGAAAPDSAVRRERTSAPSSAPRRHHVTELTALAAHITEYRRQAVVCPACAKTTQAAVPVEVATLVAYLTVVYSSKFSGTCLSG